MPSGPCTCRRHTVESAATWATRASVMNDETRATPAFYERYWASQKDGKPSDFAHKWPDVQRLIPREPGLTILDYGCCTGKILQHLRLINSGARYIGGDASETALGTARSGCPEGTCHHHSAG